ncbi:hypothetical protein EMEDMD4_270140 [Sinorhizobium medicae]|uniref:Uncharacterized protein n=1 Tax=Sinorhizobium medicae TaxID=110321 RepID=A0A508WVK1_9HYPH|nr:hypothetical protein EMEDMD4_270140 [Sinorhizobium medicae]
MLRRNKGSRSLDVPGRPKHAILLHVNSRGREMSRFVAGVIFLASSLRGPYLNQRLRRMWRTGNGDQKDEHRRQPYSR